jgi:GH25 family lysozyme M1 (1,4-beta-N-acetylmuramidase)
MHSSDTLLPSASATKRSAAASIAAAAARLALVGSSLALLACSSGSSSHSSAQSDSIYGGGVCAGPTTLQGVDVSRYQQSVDWSQVAEAGNAFAFMKATEGTTFVDSTFAANWAGTQAAGMFRGAYHFFHPELDPTAQANFVASTVGPLGPNDMPIVCDLETKGGVPDDQIVANAITFLQAVAQLTGKTPILYVSPGFLSDLSGLESYPLWVANYGVNCPRMPPGFTAWLFWQSGETGSVAGVSGAVDVDSFNGAVSDLMAFVGEVDGGAGDDGGPSNEGGDDGGGGEGGSCTQDLDCNTPNLNGQICVSGSCVSGCVTDDFCPGVTVCQGGSCQ